MSSVDDVFFNVLLLVSDLQLRKNVMFKCLIPENYCDEC